MKVLVFNALLLGVCTILQVTSAQDCVRANSDGGDSLPSFSDPENSAPRIAINPIQAIIKSYEFHCCGKVGGWGAYVEPGGGKHRNVYSIKFQIWRPMSGDTYVKVGENAFSSVRVSDSRIEEALSSNEQLHFQPGDRLGYYLEQDGGTNGGVQFDKDNIFNQEELWYVTGNSDIQNECRLDIGTGGDLPSSTSRGPVISISLTTTDDNCPSTFTSTMFCPTPTSSSAMTTTMVVPMTSTMAPPNNELTSTVTPPSTTSVSTDATTSVSPSSSSSPIVASSSSPIVTSSSPVVASSSSPIVASSSSPIVTSSSPIVASSSSPIVTSSSPVVASSSSPIVTSSSPVVASSSSPIVTSSSPVVASSSSPIVTSSSPVVASNSPIVALSSPVVALSSSFIAGTSVSSSSIVAETSSVTSLSSSSTGMIMASPTPAITTLPTPAITTSPTPAITTSPTPAITTSRISSPVVSVSSVLENVASSQNTPQISGSIVSSGNLEVSTPTLSSFLTPSTPSRPASSTLSHPSSTLSRPSSTPSRSSSSTPSRSSSASTTSSSSITIPVTDDSTAAPFNPPSSDSGLVIGFVVALLAVVVIAALTVVIVVGLMRRRHKRKESMFVPGVSNPNYEEAATQASKKSRRLPQPMPMSLVINANGGTNSVYESLEGNYEGIPGVSHYQAPRPSVRYNAKTDEVRLPGMKGDPVYHALGPAAGNDYDYCGPGGFNELESSLKHDLAESGLYDHPKPVRFRTNSLSKDPFETQGAYVPTLAERQTMDRLQDDSNVYNNTHFFVDDDIYWAPADTASDLYQQLASKKYREIPRNQITMFEQLGSGQFGLVCKGLWSISDNTLQLAVKTLKPNAPEDDKVKFLQEAAIMGQFLHPNVVKLYGVVTVGEPVMICLEIMTNGDLRSYLKSIDMGSTTKRVLQDLQLLFLRFAKEIAAGMDYLSKKAFVHRDLAARNVLVNDTLTCKIGDFGMARNLMDDTYYTSQGGKVPVKWTAPEALLYKKYSTDSDVWSYGMVLFEIWSVGQKPFSMHTNNEVLQLIQSGHCQCPPPGCPREIYRLMVDCWNPEHQYRPKFGVICSRLQAPATKLLYWSPEDSGVSKKASVLGAPLEEGNSLFGELRDKYKDYECID